MPRVKPNLKTNPKDIYICHESFAGGIAPNGIPRGTRLLGSSPIVQAHRQFFIEDGTPETEWPNPWHNLPAPAQASTGPG